MISLSDALTNSESRVWVCDEVGKLVYCNHARGVEGQTLESLMPSVHPRDREARLRDLRCSLVDQTRKTTQFRLDSSDVEKDLLRGWIREEIDPLWRAGQFRGLVGVGVPLAGGEMPAPALSDHERQDTVAKAHSIDGDGILTHEVRNCLTGVVGAMELLRDSHPEGRQNPLFEAVTESCDALLRMLGESLDVFRLEAGEQGSAPIVFDPIRNTQKVCMLLQKLAHEKGLELLLSLGTAVPKRVRGDAQRLNQVLVNLLSNAIKYTDQGSVSLTLGPTAEGLRFEIRDTGIGMGPELQRTMFQAYERGQAERNLSLAEGVGLGLNICRRLVKLLGGRLECESEPQTGTTFTLTVPFLTVDDVSTDHSNEPQLAIAESIQGLRALIVEDQPVVRSVLCHQLEKLGLHPTAVADGPGALEALDTTPLDLILMDLHLPALDGLETTRRIRQKLGDEPFIVGLTGEAKPGVRRRCLEAGMNDCLFKPVTLEQLASFLSSRDWRRSNSLNRV